MSIFDSNDPFDSIFREFFEEATPARRYRRETIIHGEEDERVMDLIEDEDRAFFIIELPGYTEEDITISINDRTLSITARKKNVEGIKPYLAQKLAQGLKFRRTLPEGIKTKQWKYTCKHGIVEIIFPKN